MEYFYVYILRCADGKLYVGHTDNLEKRIAEHQAGIGSVFTSKRLPVTIIFSQFFSTREEALIIEQKIKGWSFAKKLALASGNWELLQKLAQRKG